MSVYFLLIACLIPYSAALPRADLVADLAKLLAVFFTAALVIPRAAALVVPRAAALVIPFVANLNSAPNPPYPICLR